MLNYESKILDYLKGVRGVPIIKASGFQGDFNYVAMEALGENLQTVHERCNDKFTLETTLLLADQFLEIIQDIHDKYFVHRDLKPENFLLGRGKQGSRVYMIDFGLAKRYIEKNGKHIPYVEGKDFRGTLRYCSKNMHACIENSRRDDLESIGYLLVYFLVGKLPWQSLDSLKKRNQKEMTKLIAQKKFNTSLENLCKGCPEEFIEYFKYVGNLQFTEKPDYASLRALFAGIFKKKNLK
jgi:casein kinase 1